ncbi:hypothetical protein BDZ89DRAFT_1090303 [Hymenopellis radicata]|nr:hypothetical protein BDZ89DRAFT_1090303 [Hymenopellis radicata]
MSLKEANDFDLAADKKLTKKQRKAVAFRQKKSGKHAHAADSVAANEVPVLEVQDDADDAGDPVEGAAVGEGKDGTDKEKGAKGRAKAQDTGDAAPVRADKKRKRGDDVKKKNKADKETGKQRFILFVGNLKYSTSLDSIKAHFAACDPPPTVRLLTPRVTPGKPSVKSKGCAFLEFTHRNALQQALKLHHSQLDGRMINVELTAGGGGKSDARLQKVKERNKSLHGQRQEKLEKEAKEGGLVSTTIQPQRYSATSGVDQAPQKKNTWAVADNMDDEPTHRGGKRNTKARGSKKGSSKAWGTGVNSIPVG